MDFASLINHIRKCGLLLLYKPILLLLFHNDIWDIYKSYHCSNKKWKKVIWNEYMIRHAASISIDANINLPIILPHGVSGIFISQSANIGKNAVIFQQVTIGANTIETSKSYGAPNLGNNVYVGAGAKIIGSATIGDNCRIGANAVVVDNIPDNSVVVCTKPRVIIKSENLNNTFNPFLGHN